MEKLLMIAVFAATALADNDNIVNYNRACPGGLFYAGEVLGGSAENNLTRDIFWEKGETSPIYSCYKFMQEETNFVDATLTCNNLYGQLVSINHSLESVILESQLFIQNFPQEMLDDLDVIGETKEVFTSGMELSKGNWTWLGSGEPIEDEIVENIEGLDQISQDQVKCLSVRWEKMDNDTRIVYRAVPCINIMNTTLCEVQVYTQTWYAWMYTNWLQLLFFFSLAALLICTCCMFQSLYFRNARPRRQVPTINTPPPYTPNPTYTPQYQYTENYMTKTNKYVQKGKDVLSKVHLTKPKADDQIQLSTA